MLFCPQYVMRFNSILGLNFNFLFWGHGKVACTGLEQRKIKFKPRIKLNHIIMILLMLRFSCILGINIIFFCSWVC